MVSPEFQGVPGATGPQGIQGPEGPQGTPGTSSDTGTDIIDKIANEPNAIMTLKTAGVSTIPSIFNSSATYRFATQERYAGIQGIATGSQQYHKFYLFGDRARGTIASPTPPLAEDHVFEFLGRIYDGNDMKPTAGLAFVVDGPVSNEIAPQRIQFYTGTGAGRLERLSIKSDGKITINNLQGSYVGGSAYVCVNNNGQLYTSESGCP